tara:strand:+ start:13264 stop:14439 length:1176 start_codon:yes stop_codon:yes gene_type:complete
MAISITQGPKPNAGLAALSYDKLNQANVLGATAKYEQGLAKDQAVSKAFERMQDNFQKAQINGAKVQAGITQNPTMFIELEGGNDATSKAYQRYMNGSYTQQDVSVLSSYIDAANTQNQQALQAQQLQQVQEEQRVTKAVESYVGAAIGNTLQYAKDNDVDVSQAIFTNAFSEIGDTITDPSVKSRYNASFFNFSDQMAKTELKGTALMKDFKFSEKQYQAIHDFIEDDNYTKARQKLNSLGVNTTYKDNYGDIKTVSNADLRERFGPEKNVEDDGVDGVDEIAGSTITYTYEGREVPTVGVYKSGNKSLPKAPPQSKKSGYFLQDKLAGVFDRKQGIPKVTKNEFETYTIEAQKAYLTEHGEEFIESEPVVPSNVGPTSNPNIQSISISQ